MKYFYLLLFTLSLQLSFAQQTINDTFMFDGLERSYILYVPAIYQSNQATPLVFNFHGYTSNAGAQMFYGDFRAIADTANFIIVHPMGTIDNNGQPFWNANWGAAVDDIGFTSAIIDRLNNNYNIDLNRVYSTGMSNGGFMSYALACDLSDKIAAIASVTGSMLSPNLPACNPTNLPVPVMQIHGTADGVVPYDGTTGGLGVVGIEDVLDFWVGKNICSGALPSITPVPDIDPTDGCTAERWLYDGCANNTTMEFYKVNGGAHTWPGTPFVQGATCQDFNASVEIWRFFSQFDINGRITSSTEDQELSNSSLTVGPVPFNNTLNIHSKNNDGTIEIFNTTGEAIYRSDFSSPTEWSIQTENWSPGIYLIKVVDQNSGSPILRKVIKSQ